MDQLVDYLCIIQARLNSSRLPAKIMLDLAGKTLLERVYETVSKSTRLNKIIVATSEEKTDDIVESKLTALGIECFRGDLHNVLKRFYDANQKYQAKNIVRITADNPLMDGVIIDNLITYYEKEGSDYSMFLNGIYGLSAEVFSSDALNYAYENAYDSFDKEHVTPCIKLHCKNSSVDIEEKYRKPEMRVSIDTLDDYRMMQEFYLYCEKNALNATIDTFLERKR